jgi:hypothetical protein
MMQHEHISDAEIDGWLKTLGIASLCQWDVLVFLYRHQTSLVSADFIARLLGYASGPVIAALEVLEFLGILERFRVSQIVRLYKFTAPSDPREVTPGPASWPWAVTVAAGCASPSACEAVTKRTRIACNRPSTSWPRPSSASRRPGGGGTPAEEDMTHG